jgi:hypothetical protein
MSKNDLIARLLMLPDAIARAERDVLAAESHQRQMERTLLRFQDRLLLNGESVNGKNAEIRGAQLRQHTDASERDIAEAVESLQQARISLNLLLRQHSSLKAIAGVLGGEL